MRAGTAPPAAPPAPLPPRGRTGQRAEASGSAAPEAAKIAPSQRTKSAQAKSAQAKSARAKSAQAKSAQAKSAQARSPRRDVSLVRVYERLRANGIAPTRQADSEADSGADVNKILYGVQGNDTFVDQTFTVVAAISRKGTPTSSAYSINIATSRHCDVPRTCAGEQPCTQECTVVWYVTTSNSARARAKNPFLARKLAISITPYCSRCPSVIVWLMS
eukprot:1192922-Prorocentrum_minimum.AAC.2